MYKMRVTTPKMTASKIVTIKWLDVHSRGKIEWP